MKFCSITICTFLLSLQINAQVFKGTGGYIQDYAGGYNRQEYLCEVFGLPLKADTVYGLEKAMISIRHGRVSDLKITLEAPDGSNMWLTNRNGRDTGKNYMNTSFSQEAGKYIHEGTAPFNGEFMPDGRMEYLNNNQNPNGYWKLIIEDLKENYDGILDSFSLTFSNNPAKIKIVKPCSFESPELCVCANGEKEGDLLPDLVILPFFTQNQIEEYAWNDSIYPGQLRFAATIANIGYGPMEIRGTKEWYCEGTKVDSLFKCTNGMYARQLIVQRIYYKENNALNYHDEIAGTMYLDDHPGHNHYHVDDWVVFKLTQVLPGSKKQVAVTKGQKVSYCLFSSGICSSSDNMCKIFGNHFGEGMPNYGLGNYSGCNTEKQGITVGGYDTYGMMYEGQYLQLPKGLKSGEYILEIEIDPYHKYIESDKSNNTFQMKINIQKQEQ